MLVWLLITGLCGRCDSTRALLPLLVSNTVSECTFNTIHYSQSSLIAVVYERLAAWMRHFSTTWVKY